MSALLNAVPTDSLAFLGQANFLPKPGVTDIPVEIIWANDVALPWTTGEKQLTRDLINGLGSQPWFQVMRDYPTAGGLFATNIHLDQEVDTTTAIIGANWLCQPTGVVTGDLLAVENAVNNATLPDCADCIYLVLASNTDVSYNCGAGGQHYPWGGRSWASSRRGLNTFTMPTPNGDVGLDFELTTVGHEIAEAIGYGWISVSADEMADACAGFNSLDFYSNAYLAHTNQAANISILGAGAVQRNYIIQDLWTREQGGRCTNGLQVAALPGGGLPAIVTTPCTTNGGCGTFSGICTLPIGHCAVPTCSDGIKNGWETDVDCGMACGLDVTSQRANCTAGQTCASPFDCAFGLNCNLSTFVCQ